MSLATDWLAAFALSQAVEVPLVTAAVGRGRRARVAALAFTATALTHPVVWFVFPRLGLSYAAYVWAAELFAWLAETAFYTVTLRPLGWERALLLSLAANAASAGLGAVLL